MVIFAIFVLTQSDQNQWRINTIDIDIQVLE
jgi:hypothetical protein